MKKSAPFRVLLDEGVPDSIGHTFKSAGHEVILHREILEQGIPDQVVCAAALQHDAVLVAVDADMKRLVKRFGSTADTARFKRLSVIRIGCNGPMAAKRIEQAHDLLVAEWAYSQAKVARRLFVDISPHSITTHR